MINIFQSRIRKKAGEELVESERTIAACASALNSCIKGTTEYWSIWHNMMNQKLISEVLRRILS